jgi:uncharacterized lipoprotein YbaY
MRHAQIVSTLLIILACACGSSAQNEASGGSETISGHVSTLGLDALPWHSTVHIYLQDESAPHPHSAPLIVAEKTVVTQGEQIPLSFSLSVPSEKIESTHQYSICAAIRITDKPTFTCDKPVLLRFRKPLKPVQIMVKRLP